MLDRLKQKRFKVMYDTILRLRKLKRQRRTPEFLRSRQDDTTECERAVLGLMGTQKLSESLIEANWEGMSTEAQEACCRYQELSLKFIEEHWPKMSYTQRALICRHKTLNRNFVRKHWDEMSETQQANAIRFADPLFIHNHWEELNETQKFVAMNTGFLHKLPLSMLPKYQASNDPKVRKLAEQHLVECLGELTTEELPNFLTDTDPVVREVAKKLMEKEVKVSVSRK